MQFATETAAAEINARTIVPWHLALELTGTHDRLLRQRCALLGIPEIKFSRKSRGILLADLDRLIGAHAIPAAREVA